MISLSNLVNYVKLNYVMFSYFKWVRWHLTKMIEDNKNEWTQNIVRMNLCMKLID